MFQTTRWSVFLAGREDPDGARLAVAHLCQAYRRPVLSYVRQLGYAHDDAEDLTQSFFASMIERRLDARADPLRGRFRTMLLTALRNFLQNAEAARFAERRGGGSAHAELEDVLLADSGMPGPEQMFVRQWALTVLDRAMQALADDAERHGKRELFDSLREFLIESPSPEDYAQLAERHALRPNTIAVAVHRLRERLRQQVRAELAETVASKNDLDAELALLRAALRDRQETGSGLAPATAL